MVGGQVDDLDAQVSGGSLERLHSIHARKTGALLCVALRIGGTVASADTEQIRMLETYGEKLGLAFQIVDDLLDVEGDEHELGKRTQKDMDRGKLTFPGLLGIDESRQRAEALIEEAQASLAPLGPAASNLELLAQYVVQRKN